jgi:hypothetical protein
MTINETAITGIRRPHDRDPVLHCPENRCLRVLEWGSAPMKPSIVGDVDQ